MVTPDSKSLISRNELRAIAEVRMKEAEHLLERGLFAGAMFLGGCALECFLKLAICCTLKLDELPPVFKTHKLEDLILYTGLQKEMRGSAPLRDAFDLVVDAWKPDGRSTFLYSDPLGFDRKQASQFLSHLRDPEHGVITWLKNRLS